MKNNILVLSLLLISSILCIEKKDFDLTNGDKLKFTIQKDGVYKFYAKANFAQNATIAFYTQMIIESPFYYVSIYEYSNRYDEIANNKKNLSMTNIKGGHTDSVTFASYIVNSPKTNYIAFEVSPKQQIKYTPTVKIDVIDGVYYLSNRESKKINNIKSGGIYIFYVPANEGQQVNINLTTNYISKNPFNKLEISEYLLINNNFDDKVTKNQSISKTTKTSNNELISSFSYIVSLDTYSPYFHNYNLANYIALKVIPSNISYLIVQFDVLIYYYTLSNGDFTLSNLKADTTYNISMKLDKYQKANFSLEIYGINEKPFNYINIYEYINKDINKDYAYIEKENQTILFSSKEGHLITSFSYMLKSIYQKTNCISINIKPLFDIKSIIIKKDIIGGIFDLSRKVSSKNLTNLKSGGQYYFLISTKKFQNITFNVVLDNSNIKPFETVTIKEYNQNTIRGSNGLKTTEIKLSFSSSNNQLISTFSYIVSKDYNIETSLLIIPNSNINYINVKIEVEDTFYSFYTDEKEIYNLTVGNTYYLYKHIFGYEVSILNLELMMGHIDNKPFRSIKAYEANWDFDYDNKNKSKRIYPDIKTNTINGSLIISSSYKTILQSFSSIVFELSPNYNISYLKAIYKVEYEDESTENKTMENETMENETMENDTKGNDKENEKSEENKGEDDSKKSHNVFIYITVGLVSLILIITIVFIIKRINKAKMQELYYSSIEKQPQQQQQNLLPLENNYY